MIFSQNDLCWWMCFDPSMYRRQIEWMCCLLQWKWITKRKSIRSILKGSNNCVHFGAIDTDLPVIFSPHLPFSYDNRRTLTASFGAFSPLADCCSLVIVRSFRHLGLNGQNLSKWPVNCFNWMFGTRSLTYDFWAKF